MACSRELLQSHRGFADQQSRVLQRNPFGRSRHEIHFGLPLVSGDRRPKRFPRDCPRQHSHEPGRSGMRGNLGSSRAIQYGQQECPKLSRRSLGRPDRRDRSFPANLGRQRDQHKSGGGETAGVGDLTGTVAVDSCAVAVCPRDKVIDNARIGPGLSIVGLSSCGKASYETFENSGIGSNGLTSPDTNFFLLITGTIIPKPSTRKPTPTTFTADRTG